MGCCSTILVIYLLIFYQFCVLVFCLSVDEKFYLRPEFHGKGCASDDIAFTETVQSKTVCTAICSQSSSCKCVSYNSVDNTCIGCTGIYSILSNLLDKPGYVFYESETHKDECASSPCQNDATCVDEVYAYTCVCSGGWTGTHCETDIDECSSNPCQNGGMCLNSQNQYTCTCVSGWTGTDCDIDVDECASDPCNNGAMCQNEMDMYTCVCASGWTGLACDIDVDECSSNPCMNGATCIDEVDMYICLCDSGWTGPDCDIDVDECSSNPCMNGATCIDEVDMYICLCVSGWTGARCDIDVDECSSNPCMNGATCLDEVDMYICLCDSGWTGARCDVDVDECSSNPCMNGATCIDEVDMYICLCDSGWTGARCDVDVDECSSNPCMNGATCIDEVDMYICLCDSGWTGARCDIDVDECNSNPCMNGATCLDEVDMYICLCVSGWTGPDCDVDVDECSSNPCMNGATCLDNMDMYTCICVSGWAGPDCDVDVDECSSSPCLNGGTCADGIDQYVCTCVYGWTGETCFQEMEVAGSGSQTGTEFITGFMSFGLYNDGTPHLLIVSSVAGVTNVWVTIPHISTDPVHHELTDFLYIDYPASLLPAMSTQITTTAVQVTSDQPVTLYTLSVRTGLAGGTVELPTSVLGNQYIVDAHSETANGKSQILIIGISDNTAVTLNFPSGSSASISLNKYEVYQYRMSSVSGPLAGTTVSADSPVMVRVGHNCANVPSIATVYCDFIVTSVPPTETLGRLFLVPYQRSRTDYSIGVSAPYDGTLLTIRDVFGTTIESAELNARGSIFRTYSSSKIISITSSQDILVIQYGHGSSNSLGDPSAMVVPAVEQFASKYDFVIPGGFNNPSIISVISDVTYDVSELRLNGLPVTLIDPHSVHITEAENDFNVAYIEVVATTKYTLSHLNPSAKFGAVLYVRSSGREYTTALGYNL